MLRASLNDKGIWNCEGRDSKNNLRFGRGLTEQQAIDDCQKYINEKNKFWALSERERLKIYITNALDIDQAYSADLPDILFCIGKLLDV